MIQSGGNCHGGGLKTDAPHPPWSPQRRHGSAKSCREIVRKNELFAARSVVCVWLMLRGSKVIKEVLFSRDPQCLCSPVERWRLRLSNGASLASQLAYEEENGICRVDNSLMIRGFELDISCLF